MGVIIKSNKHRRSCGGDFNPLDFSTAGPRPDGNTLFLTATISKIPFFKKNFVTRQIYIQYITRLERYNNKILLKG